MRPRRARLRDGIRSEHGRIVDHDRRTDECEAGAVRGVDGARRQVTYVRAGRSGEIEVVTRRNGNVDMSGDRWRTRLDHAACQIERNRKEGTRSVARVADREPGSFEAGGAPCARTAGTGEREERR